MVVLMFLLSCVVCRSLSVVVSRFWFGVLRLICREVSCYVSRVFVLGVVCARCFFDLAFWRLVVRVMS